MAQHAVYPAALHVPVKRNRWREGGGGGGGGVMLDAQKLLLNSGTVGRVQSVRKIFRPRPLINMPHCKKKSETQV